MLVWSLLRFPTYGSGKVGTVDSVLMAAGIIPDAEPQRALALIAATVPAKTQKRIAAVISAAGL